MKGDAYSEILIMIGTWMREVDEQLAVEANEGARA
jgi:hypothetical protein